MRVDFIHYPFCFTDDGRRIEIAKIDGLVNVGSELAENAENGNDSKPFKVLSNNANSDCVNGVCPAR